jgi:DNA-damage-inducible protein D
VNSIIKNIEMSNLKAIEYKSFEAIKHLSEDGNEFWYARELAAVLEYVQWRNFQKVLDRAILACKNSGYGISDHFAEVRKTIEMPKTALKQITDYRWFCILYSVAGGSD